LGDHDAATGADGPAARGVPQANLDWTYVRPAAMIAPGSAPDGSAD